MEELRESQLSYAHLAQHDALTSLPNRILFSDRLKQAIQTAHRHRQKLAVLFIDLDGFKLINDSYGHSFGDEVLKCVALRIQCLMREDDTIARMGGDEFTVVLNNISRSEDAALVTQKILDGVRHPYHLQGRTVFLSASIGVSIYPEHASNLDDLVRKADTAMYRAKELGRNTFRYYSGGMTSKVFERMTLETQLREALEQGQFELHYQPQLSILTGRVTGIEALVRWQHPQKGLVSPIKFIPLAEESGLIIPIGEWILEAACRQMKTWLDEKRLLEDAVVCVNISARQFDQQNLITVVQERLNDSGLSASNLELEITESTMLRSAEFTGQVLSQLRNLGVKVAIDDFGTGYSSLSHLKRLPFTKLKIDKSFVSDIPADTNDVAIAQAIIRMGKSLSLDVLAEGIETERQLSFLAKETCDSGQGFFFSKPLSAPDLEQYLDAFGGHLLEARSANLK
jgi:diguanylate cyclase (GGDEF)-like protein